MHPAIDITLKNRQRLVKYIEELSVEQLNHIPSKFNNNIIWNIIHVIAVQQALVYGLSGLPFKVEKEMVKNFGKGTKPERDITAEEISEIKTLLISTIENTMEDLDNKIFQNYKNYTVSLGKTLVSAEDAISFNNYHEGLHLGSIMALRKFV